MNIKLILFTAVLSLFFSNFLYSQNPERTEQLIYSILAFDGKDYSGTFCREDSDTIYLMANASSFLSPKTTFVYYWPITEEWKTDTEILDKTMEGALEITGKNGFNKVITQTRLSNESINHIGKILFR